VSLDKVCVLALLFASVVACGVAYTSVDTSVVACDDKD
jgi:hypothetical protein